ncbi:unnamed protein product [Peronospora belbahrii]|uniref:Uncharacterized protein n=1 Tax=Peronospora belbahrii TaxID=622444 RepID=A0AAU9L4R0_9STRA|nr:unnamed protein product [Peronospora belbahrii]CAH0515885.1 unnamed protein product [Peronospora belbahrii]
MEFISAIEDALLRGEWTQALNDSRSLLTARIVELPEESSNLAITMTTQEEQVLSVYLQAVFELALDDEVETAMIMAKAFSPLPSHIAIHYCNFLIAMNRRLMAKQVLQDLLESLTRNRDVNSSVKQYVKAVEIMALQVMLPHEGIEAAQQFVTSDNVLNDEVKLQLLCQIQTMHLATQEANEDSLETLSVNQTDTTASSKLQTTDVTSQSMSTPYTRMQPSATKIDDDSSTYVIIGGTAVVLAVAAAGALRYREKIHDCISNVIPAISKGIADAKYALFEA